LPQIQFRSRSFVSKQASGQTGSFFLDLAGCAQSALHFLSFFRVTRAPSAIPLSTSD
jgi:hypothetical protein